ncbi:protein-disulfide reductase DsbD family protein [Aliiroseovarius sp. KMU-50]|uniref:Protein-disulfide reductase DsbD family protein n=1 Tax=Aliiroseovarius salicola TaxID=3009082 RepID=A0ABT4W5H3_9RHOB|nr:protein-disulfide reductase DsbD domain-containing protein [Aliiroseovarius sp. KMU-50]MDA5095772.1 protein-disulfide reductase DsbD family protein [Aliiroseovarius sp. KMU-50]
MKLEMPISGKRPTPLQRFVNSSTARIILVLILALGLIHLMTGAVRAATSETFSNDAVSAKLISVQDGVPPGSKTLSAALDIELSAGWKTYWRSPGEVGIPPQIHWTGSSNVANVEMLWPAPERFTAFGIENFGYHNEVVFPLKITLDRPGEPVEFNASVNLLVCSDVCVPETFDLALSLASASTIDTVSAERISTFLSRVPVEGDRAAITGAVASVDGQYSELTLELRSDIPFETPDVFAELGEGTALGKPDIRLSESNRRLWARIPILSVRKEFYHDPVLTVTDGPARALTITPILADSPPTPPFSITQVAPDLDQMAWIAIIAFLGGLILNVMPCVLPVLSIKLSSAIKAHARDPRSVRVGFLVAAAGVMAFMWMLAAILYILQQLGVAVGWGLQFQNPAFIALIFVLLAIFAANLFGLFEFGLPSSLQSRLANTGGPSVHSADFATGFFGAVLATPCSAPFLGTAIAFALSGRGMDIFIVFTALGLGLALPYLLVAALPGVVRVLPKPGRWMIWLKLLLGVLLLGTALWLLWVLTGVAGTFSSFSVAALSFALILVLTYRPLPAAPRGLIIFLLAVLPMVSAESLAQASSTTVEPQAGVMNWVSFDRGDIARRVSRGEVVFLDVTADWCLTCKANKALVLERDPVFSAIKGNGVVAMQADWTRPDESIARFLEANNRYGIPFNAVYGPGAPNGILLSEILSAQEVLAAFKNARGTGALSNTLAVGQ